MESLGRGCESKDNKYDPTFTLIRSMQGANAQQVKRLEEMVEKLEARNRELLEAFQVWVGVEGGVRSKILN